MKRLVYIISAFLILTGMYGGNVGAGKSFYVQGGKGLARTFSTDETQMSANDKNEYLQLISRTFPHDVALAISPKGWATGVAEGYGGSTEPDRAIEIALNNCRRWTKSSSCKILDVNGKSDFIKTQSSSGSIGQSNSSTTSSTKSNSSTDSTSGNQVTKSNIDVNLATRNAKNIRKSGGGVYLCEESSCYFAGADLSKIMFGYNCNLIRMNAAGANFHRSFFPSCSLSQANISNATLTMANLGGSRGQFVNFGNSNLSGADCSSTKFTESNFDNVNFTGSNFRHAHLSQSSLSGADLSNANFRVAKLKNVDLSGAILDNTNLEYADLTGADLSGVDLTTANLKGAILEDIITDSGTIFPKNPTVEGIPLSTQDLNRLVGIYRFKKYFMHPSWQNQTVGLGTVKAGVEAVFSQNKNTEPVLLYRERAAKRFYGIVTKDFVAISEDEWKIWSDVSDLAHYCAKKMYCYKGDIYNSKNKLIASAWIQLSLDYELLHIMKRAIDASIQPFEIWKKVSGKTTKIASIKPETAATVTPPAQDKAKNDADTDSSKKSEKPKLKGTGSGFFVYRNRVVTAAHVVDDCKGVSIWHNKKDFVASVAKLDLPNDLALLKTSTDSKSVGEFRSGKGIRQGESVISYGYPLFGQISTTPTFSRGEVNNLSGVGNNSRFLQYDAATQPGNSGGPLLDLSGNIVGVVSAGLSKRYADITGHIAQNVNFAVKSSVAEDFLSANDVDYKFSASKNKLELPDIAEKAEKFTVLVGCWE